MDTADSSEEEEVACKFVRSKAAYINEVLNEYAKLGPTERAIAAQPR